MTAIHFWRIFLLIIGCVARSAALAAHEPILVIGATGGTGLRALKGMLNAGCEASQLRLLTRNPNKCKELEQNLGVTLVQADLEEEDTTNLEKALEGCVGCYVHALAGDTRKATLGGSVKAQRLLAAVTRKAPECHIVMNSAAAEKDNGVNRIGEMHAIETVLEQHSKFTALRANLFMEELWKTYTRPSILKGKFPFSVPTDRSVHLTSVRDMGQVAGTCILQKQEMNKKINVAGDVLTAGEIATTFGEHQAKDCRHSSGKVFALFCRLFCRDLFQIIRFYRKSTETTNVVELRKRFPFLTNLADFLDETDWGNESLSFEDFGNIDRMY